MKKLVDYSLNDLLSHPDKLVRSLAQRLLKLLELLKHHEEEKEKIFDCLRRH